MEPSPPLLQSVAGEMLWVVSVLIQEFVYPSTRVTGDVPKGGFSKYLPLNCISCTIFCLTHAPSAKRLKKHALPKQEAFGSIHLVGRTGSEFEFRSINHRLFRDIVNPHHTIIAWLLALSLDRSPEGGISPTMQI